MKLYQFQSGFEKQIECFRNSTLWYSNVKEFNDITDCKFKIIKTANHKKFLKYGLSIDYQNWIINENRFFACCFTKNNFLNLLMWTFYGNKGKGFCLEFDKNEDFKIDFNLNDEDINNKSFKKISYKNNKNVLKIHLDKNQTIIKNFSQYTSRDLIFSKKKCFEFEKEVRLVIELKSLPKKEFEKGFNKKYWQNDVLKAIYLGVNISEEIKNKLLQIAKEKKITCYQIFLDQNLNLKKELIFLDKSK